LFKCFFFIFIKNYDIIKEKGSDFMSKNKNDTIKEIIKKIQIILVEDMGIPLSSAKKINNLLNLITQILDKE
jgi:hypothetical protein